MKLHRHAIVIVTILFCTSLYADATLETCSKKKIRQMELIERKHSSTSRSKKSSKRVSVRQQVEQIDEWLWKNCRSHAAEMRQIEQQYM